MRSDAARPTIILNLDVGMPLKLLARLAGDRIEPANLRPRFARLADHGATLTRLAELRDQGLLQLHDAVVQTVDLACDSGTRHAVRRLSASIVLDGVAWPAPDRAIVGLAEMTCDHVPVHALMRPGPSLLADANRARAAAWAKTAFVSGLPLQLDPDALWPTHQTGEDSFAHSSAWSRRCRRKWATRA